MSRIHATAVVHAAAEVADTVEIGPYCVVGPDVRLQAGVRLLSHVVLEGPTELGEGCLVHPFVRLGGAPQDQSYRGEPTRLEIGPRCEFREGVTVNRGTARGRGLTRIGARGYFMANAHVGHDCVVGDEVVFAQSATLGGHVEIGDGVTIGGLSAVHQRVRIGRLAMIGGLSGVAEDVPPFTIANGQRTRLHGLNRIGLLRRGFSRERLRRLRACYDFVFLDKGAGVFSERVATARDRFADCPEAMEMIAFIVAGGERAISRAAA